MEIKYNVYEEPLPKRLRVIPYLHYDDRTIMGLSVMLQIALFKLIKLHKTHKALLSTLHLLDILELILTSSKFRFKFNVLFFFFTDLKIKSLV